MKKIGISDLLLDSNKEYNTWRYCAPIFISEQFGTHFYNQEELLPIEIDEKCVRNGTVTFLTYKNEIFALTCAHVVSSLKTRQQDWKKEMVKKVGFEPPIDGFHFFTPQGKGQYHFNYEFTIDPESTGTSPDIAITRIDSLVMERIDRQPIALDNQTYKFPATGIASGYAEYQRVEYVGEKLNTFSPKFIACLATLELTSAGNLLLQDKIEHHNGVDNLSGMSGGPIIWSEGDSFGLAGIVKKGYDIQSKEGGLSTEDNIRILGERITVDTFEKWLSKVPGKKKLQDQTKMLHATSELE